MNAVTIRSAAPLSIIAWPAIAASAITMPMVPAVRPKPSATRAIFAAGSPGASRLTTIAAAIRARNALRRSPRIPPRIVAIPTSRISRGCMCAQYYGGLSESGTRSVAAERRRSAQRVAERPPVTEPLGEAQGKDALACRTLHLDGALGQRRAATAARTHGVARSPLDRQVDRVVGTVDDGPDVRAHGHDLQAVAWDAAGALEHVEPGGVRREAYDLIPGAAPHAHVHVARHAGPRGHVRHGLPPESCLKSRPAKRRGPVGEGAPLTTTLRRDAPR